MKLDKNYGQFIKRQNIGEWIGVSTVEAGRQAL